MLSLEIQNEVEGGRLGRLQPIVVEHEKKTTEKKCYYHYCYHYRHKFATWLPSKPPATLSASGNRMNPRECLMTLHEPKLRLCVEPNWAELGWTNDQSDRGWGTFMRRVHGSTTRQCTPGSPFHQLYIWKELKENRKKHTHIISSCTIYSYNQLLEKKDIKKHTKHIKDCQYSEGLWS